ncbi:ESPR-type extended signal peptide-containing protein [Acinetobacter entericus]|uniref:ESPR-type extended signal peptide-containing protein n=1 Tax=Acinetobacter entericus TaxID=2989714 RepID=A0ABT3NJZ5_9GAMM|nr:ESPR-type extended signal peptide-containing protein [Acinetobacter entericus]MCW8039873.1 ESPR-type extended signal peptide-containing protein [Acinetobacter entericus]
MNHVYRIIWNETLGAWVAVAENVKRKGKRSTSKTALQSAFLLALPVIGLNAYAYDAVTTCKPTSNTAINCTDSNNFTQTTTLGAGSYSNSDNKAIGAKAKAEDGKNGRTGVLFVPPTSGKPGGDTGLTYVADGGASIDVQTGVVVMKFKATSGSDTYIKTITLTPKDKQKLTEYTVVESTQKNSDPSVNTPARTVTATVAYDPSDEEKFIVKIPSYDLTMNFSPTTKAEAASPAAINDSLNVIVKGQGKNQTTVKNHNGIAIQAVNEGGKGGKGGSYYLGGKGKAGGAGGDASDAVLNVSNLKIETTGESIGLYAVSRGGTGGDGGGSYAAANAQGGNGNPGGEAGKAVIQTDSLEIITHGKNSVGVLAVSEGGRGGDAGGSVGIVSHQGKGSSAGKAGSVEISTDKNTTIVSNGDESTGILGQSIGGSGGNSGYAVGIAALGGSGGSGGDADTVIINNKSSITMNGKNESSAIIAQSLGGGGGSGKFGAGLVTLAAEGNVGGYGGKVVVDNQASQLITKGSFSYGILAQSIGGGGGNGGTAIGLAAIGAEGGEGNKADAVEVTQSGNITTGSKEATNSSAILAQSIGGGGGNGSTSVGAGPVSLAIGGKGGKGGAAGAVTVDMQSGKLITSGTDSSGIRAQSIGGGGGNGGVAVSAGAGVGITANIALGGNGAEGGVGGAVNVKAQSGAIETSGDLSTGVLAQSIGGGGGNGGITVAASASSSLISANVALGGAGGKGGKASIVEVDNAALITTTGNSSTGILAQSVGGGGGNGGIAVSGSIGPSVLNANIALGGKGGAGGQADTVKIINKAQIVTSGSSSSAIVSQSIGGAGGNAGGAVAASLGSANAVNLAIGGKGGAGGKAGVAKVENDADYIETNGDNSSAIVAQSIGGDGGNGGFAGAADIMGGNSIGLSFGGAGSAGAEANNAIVNSTGEIATRGNNSSAIVAQSIGGTGGNGGLALAVKAGGNGVFAANVALGGAGGAGGQSKDVSVTANKSKNSVLNTITLSTEGNNAIGILAQSIGGSGGNGGFSVAGTALTGGGYSAGVALGGGGSTGGTSQSVVIETDHNIATNGDASTAIVAQSIGGDGGNGGFAISAGLDVKAASANVSLGGGAGAGGTSGSVNVDSYGSMITKGSGSAGIIAQSLGGDGGNGGFAVSGGTAIGGTVSVGLGGSGAKGGKASAVSVKAGTKKNEQITKTSGESSTGILAQSLGGSGGNGGFSVAAGASANLYPSASVGVSLGGKGGNGGTAGSVTLVSSNTVITEGNLSSGLQAQSIGGGGGNGGFSVAGSAALSLEGAAGAISVALGGGSGKGGNSGNVKLNSDGDIETSGNSSHGVVAQSIGGDGGTGGFAAGLSLSASLEGAPAFSSAVTVGGNGGTGGKSGEVKVTVDNDIATHGNNSSGIIAQSIGGSGGDGGFSTSVSLALSAKQAISLGASVGGNGGDANTANTVSVNNSGSIETTGNSSSAILAQSINGSGGNGGFAANLSGAFAQELALSASVSVGGKGGNAAGYNASTKKNSTAPVNNVSVRNIASIDANTPVLDQVQSIATAGSYSNGILAQSIGGNGGNGGLSIAGSIAGSLDSTAAGVSVSVGGQGGNGGRAGNVGVVNKNYVIATEGVGSSAIVGQSIGGEGGNGGLSVAASIAVNAKAGTGKALALSASVGGFGGNGNTAGEVSIDSDNSHILAESKPDQPIYTILTEGSDSQGILAQSIGGGGGNGGLSGSFALSISKDNSAPAASVSIGGWGGDGNTSDTVTVHSIDNIATFGNGSSGIAAQSIAGAGGNGGFGLSVAASSNLSEDKKALSASVAVGGFGGNGDAAGKANVDSEGLINTFGNYSNGVLAQSIGGGGGNGGMAMTVDASLAKNSMGLSASVGGWGGTGGTGGAVDVKRLGDIATDGARAAGILAQSIGGGGGNGGNSYSGSVYIDSPKNTDKATNITASVGGFGGSGNTADIVTINSIGNIFTSGMLSSAIQVQSIGGGGGNGGNASTMTLKLQCGDLCKDSSSSNTGNSNSGNTGTSGGSSTSGSNSTAASTAKSDTNISFSVGGWGGIGNDADDVNVTSSGILATSGRGSHGIYAQSIGGGGGDGGASIVESKVFNLTKDGTNLLNPSDIQLNNNKLTFALGVGGYKGAAGQSGEVHVEHAGVIVTEGDNAKGIFAQAIGGGGGNGGDTEGATVGVGGGALQEELAVGLSELAGVFGQTWDTSSLEGSAGDAGLVSVITKQTQLAGDIQNIIYTKGNRADAIFAQSVGGGGGVGGTASAKLAIGGDGGTAGNGGRVIVANALSLFTDGLFSRGIFAQSIGGGGGTGGDVENKATVGIGGSGKNAGNADTVTVDNDAGILTKGDGSQGILAQSIGGGGGTGGSVEQATIAIGGGTLANVLDEISDAKVKGIPVFTTATGGDGQVVTVTNSATGTIETQGERAAAIQAQSIGGGGGVGGNASGSVSVGGFGSAAGNGQNVILGNEGILRTFGKNSSAIVAQSIGGGGGDGGSSDGGVDTKDNTTKEAFISVGGNGAHAGNAGQVTVTNSSELIYTEAENSKGILVQSIGGGGGQGGSSYGIDIAGTIGGAANTVKEKLGSIGLGSGATASVISAMTSVSGLVSTAQGVISAPLQDYFNSMKNAIAGGNASGVTVKNTGKDGLIITKHNGADAIVAQSIGGGGGTSGSASGILIAGAATGAAGNAGTVGVENLGELYTLGQHAAAIVAQSIGGGGGLSSGLDQTAVYAQLGASNASGLGDAVTVTNAGLISTTGRLSQGIIAQSISGGGGSIGLSEQLSFGGTNTAQSNASNVTVHNSGYIETATDGSSAIIAQSIGGGGGLAAGTQNVLQSGAASGNSGNVSINNVAAVGAQTAGIYTAGNFAHGIMAQSIAGGGGYANQLDANGNVTGFFALNAGGTGIAGNVDVEQLGNITTQGEGSYSIFAQSLGSTNGNININVGQDSVLIGGESSGAAIGLFDGHTNTVTNAGYLTAQGETTGSYLDANRQLVESGWLDGNVINAGTGNDAIVNNGFMTGSIWLDAGQNSLTNSLNAWLVAGKMIQMNLAGASTLGEAVNSGNWAVGGVNQVGATYLAGNFTQDKTGVMYWDYDLDRSSVQPSAVPVLRSLMSTASTSSLGASDIMTVTGTATLGGSVSVNLLNPNQVTPGTFDQTIVNAQNVVDTGFTVNAVPSAVALFNKVVTNNSSAIRANIDFARTELSKNGQNLGQAINAIQLDQTSPAFGPVAAALLYRSDIAALQTAYDSISGEGNAAILQTAFNHTQGVMNDISVQSDYWRSRSNYAKNNNVYTVICDQSTADGEQCIDDSQWRVWISGQNGKHTINNDTRSGTADYSADSYRTVAGLDYAINKNTLLGFAFGSSKTQFDVADRETSGLVESNSLAFYGSKDFDKMYLKGALSYDWLDAETRRFAFVEGSTAPIVPVAGVANNLQAEFDGKTFNGRLEAGYKTNWKKLNITPFAGVQLSFAKIDAATETAAETDDLLALAYSKNDAYSAPVFVGAQLDTMFMFSEGSIQPYAKLSFAHDFSTKRAMEASFVSAPGYKFEVQGAVPDANTMDVNLGFKMTSITNLAFYGQFNGQYSENGAKNEGGTLGLEVHW